MRENAETEKEEAGSDQVRAVVVVVVVVVVSGDGGGGNAAHDIRIYAEMKNMRQFAYM